MIPGLTAAVGALIVYAHDHTEKLDARLPRFQWKGTSWHPDSIWQIWAEIANKRTADEKGLDITLRPLPPRLSPPVPTPPPPPRGPVVHPPNATDANTQTQTQRSGVAGNGEEDAAATAAAAAPEESAPQQQQRQRRGPTKRKTMATGPCAFGCQTTWLNNGVPLWKRVPDPSPWHDVPVGSTVCKKCYETGNNLRRNAKRSRLGAGHDPPSS